MLLEDLPADVLLHILSILEIQDILRLRQTSKAFHETSSLRSVWHTALDTHLLAAGTPVPGIHSAPLSSLSARDLETCARRATQLRRNWRSPRPTAHAVREVIARADAKCCNLGLAFLPGHGRRYLVSTTTRLTRAIGRRWIIECWDIAEGDASRCVARLEFESVVAVRANVEPDSPYVLVLVRRSSTEQQRRVYYTSIFGLDVSEEPDFAFKLLREFPGEHVPLLLKGDRLVAAHTDNVVRVWDVTVGTEIMQLDPPVGTMLPLKPCSGVVFRPNYAILFRQTSIETYVFPAEGDHPRNIPPAAAHTLPWRISNLAVSERLPSASSSSPTSPPLIDMFLRFDSWYPWPVNMLHHFHLRPNPDHRPGSALARELPYLPRPYPTSSWSSTIDFFTPSDMAVGPRGTALWIDSHTEDRFGAGAPDGQRLAGRTLAAPRTTEEALALGVRALSNTASVQGQGQGQHDEMGALRAMAEADERVEEMEFQVDERCLWNRVAMDEDEGRIAVGFTDGRISVYEYAPA
ncbi:hypothetical protein PUNSTDRAFT_91036 [Punctularia strigosozonata HHB-11173 SS5]|uniref:uncharacterized protein n=1 Tax=Punctularia strigosozonata (strain HHB-11173) TaxID=741275 RepID=UPI00044165B5|nr:uncharacterized protein PUNSTDRAFT_91036 [Punctularia strigosozonata HHB-11173 SS5]EIN06232.1 hypothetical protein PUNSTDRAFT_91036 [Punctularia strigosozonata HHB-11173 SS5]